MFFFFENAGAQPMYDRFTLRLGIGTICIEVQVHTFHIQPEQTNTVHAHAYDDATTTTFSPIYATCGTHDDEITLCTECVCWP